MFEPLPKKCPKCKRVIKIEETYARHLISQLILMEHKIRVPRRRIVGVGDCKCSTWFELK